MGFQFLSPNEKFLNVLKWNICWGVAKNLVKKLVNNIYSYFLLKGTLPFLALHCNIHCFFFPMFVVAT